MDLGGVSMGLYAGIDLHSSNNYIGIIDDKDKRVYSKRHTNQLPEVLSILRPFRRSLKGVVVESTYNWYWLVDGLQDNGYKVHLANPAAIQQYQGLKHTDDRWDSFWLAHLLRLGILPEGYIYPKKDRPVRDILRRRTLFVRYRTSQILSLQSTLNRNLGHDAPGNLIKQYRVSDSEDMFDSPLLNLTAKLGIETIRALTQKIELIEKEVLSVVKLKPEFAHLRTVPGIGKILGLTIMLEVGDIGRFKQVGNYSSYCRCVKSVRLSNGKKKGKGNQKNGNKHLGWAYVEAAHFSTRYCSKAQSFYQRKKAKGNGAIATKALANKLARASYYIMRDKVPFDEEKLFA
jgi:transposase